MRHVIAMVNQVFNIERGVQQGKSDSGHRETMYKKALLQEAYSDNTWPTCAIQSNHDESSWGKMKLSKYLLKAWQDLSHGCGRVLA